MPQVLEPLRDEEYAALRADIERRAAILIPIEVDASTGLILDGHNRQRIADELGIEAPVNQRELNGEDPVEFALKMNLLRRHLGPIQWAHAFDLLAEIRAVERGRQGRQKAKTDTVSDIAIELGVNPRTARRHLALADRLKDAPDLADKVDSGEMPAKRAERVLREREKAAAPKRRRKALPPTCDIRLGDFRTVLADIPDGSIDLILTDPPYPAEFLPLWSDLGEFAKRVLKPDGMLMAMSGQTWLLDCGNRLAEHLPYRWTIAFLMGGPDCFIHARSVSSSWKPVLVYGARKAHHLHDVVRPDRPDKEFHHWGQDERGFAELLRMAAGPEAVICDPFLGGGTTAVVALAAGCSFIGAENDPETYATAAERLASQKEEKVV